MTAVELRTARLSWAAWTAGAIAAVLWHMRIDQHIGLNGPTSEDMSLLQAGSAGLDALVVAWWIFVVAWAALGDQRAVRAMLLLVVVEAVLSHGLVAFIAAPPPSDAFPYQDLAHTGALVCGVLAFREMRIDRGTGTSAWPAWVTVALLVARAAVGGSLMVSNL